MINAISINTRVYIAAKAIDFRKRIDGTAAACSQLTGRNPLEGSAFLFINKSRTMIRCYYFDGHGEWLVEKRAAQGKFPWWAKDKAPESLEPTLVNLLFRGAAPTIAIKLSQNSKPKRLKAAA